MCMFLKLNSSDESNPKAWFKMQSPEEILKVGLGFVLTDNGQNNPIRMVVWSNEITYILVIVEILCLSHAGRLPLRDELDDVDGAVVVVVELGDDPSDLIVGLGCNSVGNIWLGF